MCEYCGCQEVAAIGELTREHDEVVGLMGAVRAAYAAGDVPAMAELARRIAEILGPHRTCAPTSSRSRTACSRPP